MKRLAAYFMFAGGLFAPFGIVRRRILQLARLPFASVKPATLLGVGAKNSLGGPQLNGLVGRQAGTAARYQSSLPVKNAGFAWDETSFATFFANPRGRIPGNKMVFARIKDETEIANLWAYLSQCRR